MRTICKNASAIYLVPDLILDLSDTNISSGEYNLMLEKQCRQLCKYT